MAVIAQGIFYCRASSALKACHQQKREQQKRSLLSHSLAVSHLPLSLNHKRGQQSQNYFVAKQLKCASMILNSILIVEFLSIFLTTNFILIDGIIKAHFFYSINIKLVDQTLEKKFPWSVSNPRSLTLRKNISAPLNHSAIKQFCEYCPRL